MDYKPAFLLSESFLTSLQEHACRFVSFEDLIGLSDPWTLDFEQFIEVREKITVLEKAVRSSSPTIEITCICTEAGIHWIGDPGFRTVLEHLARSVYNDEDLASQLWRWTSDELARLHISNLRLLILGAAHDLVLLQFFRTSLGRNHGLMYREFKYSERAVWNQIEDIREEMAKLQKVSDNTVVLFERCLITQELLNRNVMTEEQLGYSQKELKKVHKVLESHCLQKGKMSRTKVVAMHNTLENALRRDESTQLTRTTRWDMVFSFMDEVPAGYRNQFRYYLAENSRMFSLIRQRESLIGSTPEGQKALEAAEEVCRQTQEKEAALNPPAPLPTPPPAPAPESASSEEFIESNATRPSPPKRMAVVERLHR